MTIDMSTPLLDDTERRAFTVIADALIPDHTSRPSASGAQVPERWVDVALQARPDLLGPLKETLAAFSDAGAHMSAPQVFDRLQGLAPELVAAVGTLTAGAYFLNPEIRQLIGYPGQEARVYNPEAEMPYLDLLERVVERGEIYQPTVASDPNAKRTRLEGELMDSSAERVVTKKSSSLTLATKLVGVAVEEGRRIGGAFSVVVVDESNQVEASARMDGSGMAALQAGADKA
ncbi:heme-binding protein [Mycobacterium sp. MBM]|nr:heme-binding protein [Mycobacterium sp. MBM]